MSIDTDSFILDLKGILEMAEKERKFHEENPELYSKESGEIIARALTNIDQNTRSMIAKLENIAKMEENRQTETEENPND